MRTNHIPLLDFIKSNSKFNIITASDGERHIFIGDNYLFPREFMFDLKHKVSTDGYIIDIAVFKKDPEYALEVLQRAIHLIKTIITGKEIHLVPIGDDVEVTVRGKLDYVPNLLNKHHVTVINEYMEQMEIAMKELQNEYWIIENRAITSKIKQRKFSSETFRENLDLF